MNCKLVYNRILFCVVTGLLSDNVMSWDLMIFNSVFLCLWCLCPRLIPVLVGIPLCVCLFLCVCLSTLSSRLYLYPCVSLSPCPCLSMSSSLPPCCFSFPLFLPDCHSSGSQAVREEREGASSNPLHSLKGRFQVRNRL